MYFYYIYLHHMLQIKKKTLNRREYKVGNNANIANIVCLWKTRLSESVSLTQVLMLWIGLESIQF